MPLARAQCKWRNVANENISRARRADALTVFARACAALLHRAMGIRRGNAARMMIFLAVCSYACFFVIVVVDAECISFIGMYILWKASKNQNI